MYKAALPGHHVDKEELLELRRSLLLPLIGLGAGSNLPKLAICGKLQCNMTVTLL